MAIIYASKTDDANKYAELGYDISEKAAAEEGHIVVFKDVALSKDDPLIKEIVKQFNGAWSVAFEDNHYYEYFIKKGIHFEEIYSDVLGKKIRSIILDDAAYAFLCDWRIEVDLSDDKYVCFTSGDYVFHFPYFCDAEKAIDKYCKKEIKELLDAGLVEKIEISEDKK